MPWTQQSGNNSSQEDNSPWKQQPDGEPPEPHDLMKGLQQNLLGGDGPSITKIVMGILLLLFIAWIALPKTGVWYVVREGERGVVLRFGEYARTTDPGLRWKAPSPVESLKTVNIELIHTDEIGFQKTGKSGSNIRDIEAESYMLTGDENIVNIHFTVQWRIKDAKAYLFNIHEPAKAVKAVAESAMRETIGRNALEPIITKGRQFIQDEALNLIQKTLDDYNAGIQIREVQLQKADPPSPVIDAFRDVVNAGQDAEAALNKANEYHNNVVPKARGDAARIRENAEAYKSRVIAEAEGEADRFRSIQSAYAKAPLVTRERLYLETMEDVLNKTDKILLDPSAQKGVVPYLPLDQLMKKTQTAHQQNTSGGVQK